MTSYSRCAAMKNVIITNDECGMTSYSRYAAMKN